LVECINFDDFEIKNFALKNVVDDNTISLCLIIIDRNREMLSSIKAEKKNPLFLFSATEKNTAKKNVQRRRSTNKKKKKKIVKKKTNKQTTEDEETGRKKGGRPKKEEDEKSITKYNYYLSKMKEQGVGLEIQPVSTKTKKVIVPKTQTKIISEKPAKKEVVNENQFIEMKSWWFLIEVEKEMDTDAYLSVYVFPKGI
jgi:hypothetical protein